MNMRGLGHWVDMNYDYTRSLSPAPARRPRHFGAACPCRRTSFPKYSEFLQRMLVRARVFAVREFRGITADGIVRPGLFPVRKTGVSLEPILRAARDFRRRSICDSSVRSRSISRATYGVHGPMCIHSSCAMAWGSTSLLPRNARPHSALVGSALSASGLRDRAQRHEERACLRAHRTVPRNTASGTFGSASSARRRRSSLGPAVRRPSPDHQLLHTGRSASAHPQFMGSSEPVFAESGKYAGTQVFRAEEAVGLAMMRGLSPEQQVKAIIGTLLPGELLTAAFNDNVRMPYEGIRYDDLSSKQQGVLRDLIGVYLHRLRPGHAEIRLEEAFDHLRDTHFSWIGAYDDHGPFYYCIYSPVVLIEFDHQPGIVYAEQRTHARSYPHGRAHSERQRLRQGPAAPARTIIPTRGCAPPRQRVM